MVNDLNSIPQPILGEWYLDEFIGSGRYGNVYKGHNASGRIVAIKIITLPNSDIEKECRSLFGDDNEAFANYIFDLSQEFGDEVESMRRIGESCPNIVQMYNHVARQNADGIGWNIYIVMEFCTVLKSHIRANGLRVYDALKIGIDVARALSACHKNKIIHRDIKEDNLFVDSDGRYKIGDFGVAKVTTMTQGEKTQVGSPYYMAPEVYTSDYGYSVDVYSLGIVLYRMFNYDRIPFAPTIIEKEHITRAELDNAHKRRIGGESLTAPCFADERIARVILRATEFNPEYRYKSADEMLVDLEGLMDLLPRDELEKVLPYPGTSTQSQTSSAQQQHQQEYQQQQQSNSSNQNGSKNVSLDTDNDFIDETQGLDDGMDGNVTTIDGNSTLYILSSIMKKLGKGPEVDNLIRKLNQKDDHIREIHREQAAEIRKGKKKNTIIGAVAAVALVALGCTAFVILNSTSYNITDRKYCYISSKSLLHGEQIFAEIPVSYLAYDNENLYYSKKSTADNQPDHQMYRMNIKTKEETLMCTDDCEHNILIGDYIYFTSYAEGEILCRINKNASVENGDQKEVIINYKCSNLKKDGNTLVYTMPDMGDKEYRLSTKSIGKGVQPKQDEQTEQEK